MSDSVTRAKKRLLCRLGMHTYVLRTSDGERYHECRHCKKYYNKSGTGSGPIIG